ncbi:28S ribosomal protein S14, mitochondrial isoform X1 [Hippopotamus amphibius kiboko]|nr:28S ribosomal protein S14, mitochondrial isoform X1 [Hippopotamus amphibius kiboko]XP_057585236.1 28S ribosomal protein S14, mitochondrial isoform X1 [Hippopotamus amphibius kiboko]
MDDVGEGRIAGAVSLDPHGWRWHWKGGDQTWLPSRLPGTNWVVPSSTSGQVRSYYVDWRMLRDVKRRKMAYEYADERLRINSLRKNTILPKDLQEVADEEIAALPRDSCPVRIRNRCVMTSRPRGVKRRWRLSRIVFRHLADHGQLSGVQRAMW